MVDSSKLPDPPEVVLFKPEEHAYGFIIEVLTRGLYPNKLHVIREYVQNGYDAMLELRRKGLEKGNERIDVRIEPPSIFIYDTGIGMNALRINEYRYVGYSKKLTSESVGFRGIGKLSGISVAEKIIVSTSAIGVPERHRLVFDAEAMLQQVERLKLLGDNISLNALIQAHTSLQTEEEDPQAHYTFVELYKIRQDSQLLMDVPGIAEYLSLTAPVDFHPDFEYGAQLDEDLRRYVDDYDTVPLFLNGTAIYKTFAPNAKPPAKLFVYPTDSTNVVAQQEGDSDPETHIAFCWYCEHAEKGQFPDRKRRGLTYRVKNFAVGDNQLPRITLWQYTPERAYYFFGEIHVCDATVVPSAARDDFEQNQARETLYQRGKATISRTLNSIAGESSDERRAREFIVSAEHLIAQVQQSVDSGQVPTELRVPKIIELSKAVENVEKRLKNAPDSFRERGANAIGRGTDLIAKLTPDLSSDGQKGPVYDIRDSLGFNQQASWVYETIIEVLRSELKPEEFEKLIAIIHQRLWGTQD